MSKKIGYTVDDFGFLEETKERIYWTELRMTTRVGWNGSMIPDFYVPLCPPLLLLSNKLLL